MTPELAPDAWVYVIVLNPGPSETYFGHQDPEKGTQYIPVFLEKSTAEKGADHLVPNPAPPYDVQAIEVSDLTAQLAGTGVVITAVDAAGQISSQITPG